MLIIFLMMLRVSSSSWWWCFWSHVVVIAPFEHFSHSRLFLDEERWWWWGRRCGWWGEPYFKSACRQGSELSWSNQRQDGNCGWRMQLPIIRWVMMRRWDERQETEIPSSGIVIIIIFVVILHQMKSTGVWMLIEMKIPRKVETRIKLDINKRLLLFDHQYHYTFVIIISIHVKLCRIYILLLLYVVCTNGFMNSS